MSYLPQIAWSSWIEDVVIIDATNYSISLAADNQNEPGATLQECEIGFYVRDNIGNTYRVVQILSVTPLSVKVFDELGVGVGPQQDRLGYVYKPVGDGTGLFIAPIPYNRLSPTAFETARPIELDVLWKNLNSRKYYHGIEAYGLVAFNNTTHILSVSSITYWYKGTKFISTTPISCDIDDYIILTTNTAYYIYFDNASGTLKCAETYFDIKETVSLVSVFWNGSAGAVQYELHNHIRNIDWHIWAHSTIGTRYDSGLGLTAPTTSTDSTLTIETGIIRDEDQKYTIGQITTMRGWYLASAVKSTFADYALPYLGTAGAPVYLRTTDYTLQTFANSDFACYWVYASLDKDRPCYITPTHAASAFNTIALARSNAAPVTVGMNNEMKLLYKFIYSGDGQFQEMVDYRTSSSIPGGGINTINAGNVSATANLPLTGNNVQVILDSISYLLSLRYTPPFTYSP